MYKGTPVLLGGSQGSICTLSQGKCALDGKPRMDFGNVGTLDDKIWKSLSGCAVSILVYLRGLMA